MVPGPWQSGAFVRPAMRAGVAAVGRRWAAPAAASLEGTFVFNEAAFESDQHFLGGLEGTFIDQNNPKRRTAGPHGAHRNWAYVRVTRPAPGPSALTATHPRRVL
jgi:hypothetical protein